MYKRLISFAGVILLAVSIVSCGSQPQSMKAPSEEKVQSPGENTKFPEERIKNNVTLEDVKVGGLTESQALNEIRKLATETDQSKIDARLDEFSWEPVQQEKSGVKVNAEKTLNALKASNENEKVKLVVEKIEPDITTDGLVNNVVILGTYTTPILDQDDSRVNNIEVAAQKLDYQIIAAGEEFSFNGTLGKRTKAKGYEQAPIIVKSEEGYKKGYGVGGGICQVASTLYNAVEKSGLQVIERHTHSKDVYYVPRGKDATVSYGSVDFKFLNNRSHPVMIRVYASKSKLTVRIVENRNL